ncbi:putative serine/threonine-protein kinase [Aspergillus puulaauensis]|uniref:non-specific serine/threonine protein kinase n=1 Tax=Aspergillus puulaauensis TaxID=1220207 RepID=A0A7R8ARU7_9EURO|nr:uncharacterized protein APUU_70082S [Aspergillus puulaauensis]BCS28512.1 hypothetical protein APUU_70082S [Aspergillus puulaauensis]
MNNPMQNMRLARSFASKRTIFSFVRKSPWHLPCNSGPLIPNRELVDEEVCPGYDSRVFYPARAGEVLAHRYQLLSKIGWGSQSTVWLARDVSRFKWESEQTVALKIVNSNEFDAAQYEKSIEDHIARQNPAHRGHAILRTCLDGFEIEGPDGRYMCLAYHPMREPFWIFQRRFVSRKLPLPLAKAYIYVLLVGLDYLHSECNVVHTGELRSFLSGFWLHIQSTLTTFINKGEPMDYKTCPETGRTVYRCHNNFGPLDVKQIAIMVPQLVDFGLVARLDKEQLGIIPIQPDHYFAPEVILGCGWNSKADIWNMGVLLWNIIGNTELFQQVHDTDSLYTAKPHLAEMVALLGPPPTQLIARSDIMAQHDWPEPVRGATGKLCSNGREFFGGPFFNEEGDFLHEDLMPTRALQDTIPFVDEKDRASFLDFAQGMLTWLPEDRKSAGELMKHPFLKLHG